MRATLAISLSWAISTGRFMPATLRSPGFHLAAQQRSPGDLAGSQGILPVLSFAQGRDVEQIQRAVNAPHRVDPLPGRLDGVFPERELVELPDTIPAALAKRVEEFEGLDQMHRADDQVVVPAPEVVVDVDSVEQAAGVDEPGGFRRRLPSVQGVAEVQQDADVADIHVLDRQQGLRGRGEEHRYPRLAGLVLDSELRRWMGLRQ